MVENFSLRGMKEVVGGLVAHDDGHLQPRLSSASTSLFNSLGG